MELKLVEGYNNTYFEEGTAAFDEPNLFGRDSSNRSRHLAFTHGAMMAQVMLHTLAWVVPILAKLGQLGMQVPWAVITVGRKKKLHNKKPNKPNNNNNIRRWTGRISQSGIKIKQLLSRILPQRRSLNRSCNVNSKATSNGNYWVSGNKHVPLVCGDYTLPYGDGVWAVSNHIGRRG